ncbi:hypothetical protein FN846DRAFT_984689 [Sphaerosporella brunnea]|uniref:Uncharacterized protein n=1 Tax=Sphaerosporella brunnea TaxID=1250544 RepID=A0A5J5F9V6_9PEZI|nr:hypothetical protein FN846DRAFT_984689 [Sphaerosporella brunnea]
MDSIYSVTGALLAVVVAVVLQQHFKSGQPRAIPVRHQPTCFRISNILLAGLEQAIREIDPDTNQQEAQLSLLPFYTISIAQPQPLPNNCRLVVDKHFYDLTPMNRSDGKIIAELAPTDQTLFRQVHTDLRVCRIIAITGLAGHALGSWRNRETHAMWLHELLPERVNSIRLMTYGYDSSLKDANRANLIDL